MNHNLVVSIFFLNSHFQIAYRKYTSSNITEMFIEKLCKPIFYLHDESHKINILVYQRGILMITKM